MLAFETGEGRDALLDVHARKRRHFKCYVHGIRHRYGYQEAAITCRKAVGLVNARKRAMAIWKELQPLLRAGKFAAVQARE